MNMLWYHAHVVNRLRRLMSVSYSRGGFKMKSRGKTAKGAKTASWSCSRLWTNGDCLTSKSLSRRNN
jgi:hypothetical protein